MCGILYASAWAGGRVDERRGGRAETAEGRRGVGEERGGESRRGQGLQNGSGGRGAPNDPGDTHSFPVTLTTCMLQGRIVARPNKHKLHDQKRFYALYAVILFWSKCFFFFGLATFRVPLHLLQGRFFALFQQMVGMGRFM